MLESAKSIPLVVVDGFKNFKGKRKNGSARDNITKFAKGKGSLPTKHNKNSSTRNGKDPGVAKIQHACSS